MNASILPCTRSRTRRTRIDLIEVIREELDLIRDKGVTEEELEQAKVAYLQAARVRRYLRWVTQQRVARNDCSMNARWSITPSTRSRSRRRRSRASTPRSPSTSFPTSLVMAIAGDFAAASAAKAEE